MKISAQEIAQKAVNETALVFTNSADEYGAGAVNIKFCRMGGRE